MLRTPKPSQNRHFQHFCAKKLKKCKKRKKFAAKFNKKTFFKVCTITLVEGFISRKKEKTCVILSGSKISHCIWKNVNNNGLKISDRIPFYSECLPYKHPQGG